MAVPAIVVAERRVVRALRYSGATTSAAASPLENLRWMEERALRRLVGSGSIREAEPGRYYVDESTYAAFRGHRRMRALVTLAALIVILGVLLALGVVR